MKYYQEITLLPDAEINLYFIWQKTYQQIHLALVEIQNPQKQVEVGVSFPQYDEKTNYLGCKLRLFAKDKTILNQLNLQKWLHRLNDYTHLTKIRDVPDTVTEFAQFKRQQVKSNAKKVRHAKRQAKRDNIEFEQAFNNSDSFEMTQVKTAFINMQSLESGHKFRLFIQKKTVAKEMDGEFSTYGLSQQATIPWF